MLKSLFSKITGDPNAKAISKLQPLVDDINALEAEFKSMSDDELLAVTVEFRAELNEALQDLRAELDAARAEAFDEADDDQRRQLDAQIKKIEDELFKAEADQLTGFLPRAFAAVREASRRHTTLRHFDVQMIGGVVLHQGKIAEMKTGEGKTLVATLPLYLNALTSRGCHLVTVNDYLARRDGGWMGPIYHALGLSVGLITHDFSGLYDPEYVDPQGYLEDERLVHWKPCTRAEAYRADITYGTSSEFGFDYLRDNLTTELSQCVQRDFYYAIVDEVDNILIDESRTPLIISGPTDEATDEYRRFAEIVRPLKRNTAPEDAEPNGDFNIDERTRAITLTERGIARVEAALVAQNVLREGESIYDPQYVSLTPYLDNGLKAQHVFKRDKEYVVMDGHVIIVDERTGRLMPGRRYSEGLHQAIEAKEGVNIRREDATLATITLQNFFRMYRKLAGMTGTAATESEEFYRIYGLEVVVIPTNVEQVVSQPESGLRPVREKADGVEQIVYQDATGRPVFHRRVDYPDQVYQSEAVKYRAIVADIKHLHEQGSPILVGTTSVENSEKLHEMLSQDKIRHEVLNAKQHQREAAIVAQAGRSGAVTISTSMAGRGTDILLGGYPEGLAIERLTELCFDERSFERLAREALADANAARQTARRDARLSPDLVDWILKAEADYEAVAAAIGSTGDLTSYLAQRLQAAPHQMAYDDALALVRYVRDGQFDAARELVRTHDYSLELIALVRSWQNDYGQHPSVQAAMRQRGQPTPDELATFLAPVLFEKHYNARAALIRSVLQGDVERAKQLVTDMPGLPAQAIEEIQAIKTRCEQDRQRVRELGGLRIIGTERYEARRIDNQLRGRAARQGDPGYSTFYLSFEDELMRRFGGDAASRLMGRFGVDENMPLEHRWVDRAIEGAQEKVESYYFDMRKNLVEYDDVVNRQRETVYGERREILKGSSANLEAQIESYFAHEIEALLDRYLDGFLPWMQSQINEAVQEHSNLETGRVNVNGLIARLRGILPQIYSLDREQLAEMDGERVGEELYHLAEAAHTQNHHIRLLAQEVTRFIPLWPALPDMRGVRDYGQRLKAEQQYKADVQNVFDGLVTEEVKGVDRAQLWAITDNAIADAFRDFAVENVSAQERRKRFEALAVNLNNAVGQMLLAVLTALDREQLEAALLDRAEQMLEKWRELIGTDDLRTYEQWLFLSTIDREWQQYLEAIDDLRQGIGLEAFGQRDPKIEYKRRALDMFEELRDSVRHTIVDNFFRQLPDHQRFIEARRANAALRERAAQANYRLEQRKRGTTMRRDVQKVNRNDPCPCGSGKKYKNCHGRLGTQPTAEASMIDQPAAGQGKQRK